MTVIAPPSGARSRRRHRTGPDAALGCALQEAWGCLHDRARGDHRLPETIGDAVDGVARVLDAPTQWLVKSRAGLRTIGTAFISRPPLRPRRSSPSPVTAAESTLRRKTDTGDALEYRTGQREALPYARSSTRHCPLLPARSAPATNRVKGCAGENYRDGDPRSRAQRIALHDAGIARRTHCGRRRHRVPDLGLHHTPSLIWEPTVVQAQYGGARALASTKASFRSTRLSIERLGSARE